MKYWLLKTEPSTYSYADLARDGSTPWDGVKNNTAQMHLRAMNAGDRAFIYHTGDEKQIVGIAEITSAPYPDPKQPGTKLVVVDVRAERAIKTPVTLSTLKSRDEFTDFDLVTNSRLGVMPVSRERWHIILSFAGG